MSNDIDLDRNTVTITVTVPLDEYYSTPEDAEILVDWRWP